MTTLVVFGVVYIVSYFIPATNWIWFFFKAIIIGSISLVLVFAFYHRSEGFKLLRNRLFGLMHGLLKRKEEK